MDATPEFDAYIGREGVTLDARDAELLRAVEREGSLNAAADALGRSYGHAQRRVVELEDAFGPLVERRRGGAGGGGSDLTDAAEELLAAFERTRAGFAGVADVAETVLAGRVRDRAGELATVETAAGPVRALVSGGDDGERTDGDGGHADGDGERTVQLSVRADAVTLNAPGDAPVPEGTSARNRFRGTVEGLDRGEQVVRVAVDVGADGPLLALVTADSCGKLGLEPGREVVASFKATATRGVVP